MATKMDPIDLIFNELHATASKNCSKNVQESKHRGTQAHFGRRYKILVLKGEARTTAAVLAQA